MSTAHFRRVTTRGLVSVLAASTLLLAGCSQTVGGTATADPNGSVAATSASAGITTPSTTAAASGTDESSSSATESGSESESLSESESESQSESSASSADRPTTDEPSTSPGDPSSSSSIDPEASLDADTLGWFQGFCGGVTDAAQYASPNTDGQTLEEAQTTVVEAYTNIAASAQVTAEILNGTPPPTFDGGGEFAQAAENQFLTLADVYGRGAETLAALPEPTETEIRDAIDAVEGEATAAQDAAPAFPPVPADLEPAVLAIPECDGVF